MTKDLALTLLGQGTNGTEILNILDAVIEQFGEMENNEPTMNPIEF